MGFCGCLYVNANVQLVQQQTLQACLCASFMPFAFFQTAPLLASVFCGVRRDTSCNRAGHSSFLSCINFSCGDHEFPVAGFSACTFSGHFSPALGTGNWGVVCSGYCASSLPLPCRNMTRAEIQRTGFICHCVIPLRAGRMHSYFLRKCGVTTMLKWQRKK